MHVRFALTLAAVATVGLAATWKDTPAKAARKKSPTYAESVAPILNERCVSCHRPGEVAPFSLIGYENAKKWAPMIASVTGSRRMPPWKAVHGVGEFWGENRLGDGQIETLKEWSESGTPRGDKKKEPKPPTFTGEWAFGQPDLVVSPSRPYQLKADGEDVYRNFVIQPNFTETVYVRSMNVKPGNPKIVHHVILFLDRSGQSEKLSAQSADGQEGYTSSGGGVGFLPSGSLGGWAPGLNPLQTPTGTAFKIEPGTRLVLQVHYHKSGKPEEDLTKVGLYFAKEPIQKEMQLAWIMNWGLNIPPGEKNYHIAKTFPVPANATLYALMPHMHLLGRSMKAHLELPDGTQKPLIEIDDWDFNWQLQYAFKEPIKMPAGSKIIVEGSYDNSADNVRNPNNPPKRVTWGEQTTDEMFLLVAAYTRD